MELTLKIYRQGRVEKTYTADQYDIMFGTVEDLVNLFDSDLLGNAANDIDFIKAVTPLVVKGFEQVKDLLKDVFPGVTDDELKRTKVKEIIPVVLDILKYSLAQIGSLSSGKN